MAGRLFLFYVALSVPLVSGWLHRTLAGSGPITDAREARGAATIVLLGNGVVTSGRLRPPSICRCSTRR